MSDYFKKTVNELIEKILINCFNTRDNDNLLAVNVWIRQNPELDKATLRWIASKGTPAESIRRHRQALQEQDEKYRGNKYKERQERQNKIRKELGY